MCRISLLHGVALATLAISAASGQTSGDEPAVPINGSFVAGGAARQRLPDRAELRLWPVGDEKESSRVIECPITGSRWRCKAPQGAFDAMLHVSGFVPRYFWGVHLGPKSSTDMGIVQLESGTSCSGDVVHDGVPVKGARVELVPETGSAGPDARRARLRARSAATGSDGTFVIGDIGRGSYLLVVSAEGYSAASRNGIAIDPARPVKLDPIEIRRRVNLAIYVTPPVDFDGQPWQIALTRPVPASAYWQVVRKGNSAYTGYWDAQDLDAGDYRVEVRTARGYRTEMQDVRANTDQIVAIDIASIPVEGSVRLGGDPVSATISLVADDGVRADFRSNAAGTFGGTLPREGTWRPIVRFDRAGTLNLPAMQVRKNDAGKGIVKIELPPGIIEGSVVDEAGQPVMASVTVFNSEVMEVTARTDDSGSFSIRGLAPGPRLVQATAAKGESGRVSVVVNDEPAHVTLLLRAARRVNGQVIDAVNQPVPGASIYFQNPRSELRQTETGLAGDFTLVVPAEAPVVWAAIVAPGLPLKLLTLPLAGTTLEPTIVLGPATGRLSVELLRSAPPWPTVSRDGGSPFALFHLFTRRAGGPPREYRPPSTYVLDLDPGTYQVCLESSCRAVTITPGAVVTARFGGEKKS